MKFRSWYVVLLGILIQAGFGFMLIFSGTTSNNVGGIIAITLGGIVLLLTAGLGIIPLLLLVFKKTRRIGAVISIIVGIVGISIQAGFIVGVFLVIGGILSLWLKT